MTRLIDLPALSQLVQAIGPAALIGQLAEAIKADFLLWPEFDKSRALWRGPGVAAWP